MNLFSYIKSKVPILDTVNAYTTLKKAGVYWKGTCPFHYEKTASFTVSPHREIFYCFGCHAGGDVITFIAKIEQCSALEASKLLVERHGLVVPKEIDTHGSSTESLAQKKQYQELCKQVALWCHQNLIKNSETLGYLLQRGLDKTTIEQFTLGYFPGGVHAIKSLLHHMQQHSFLASDLLDAHIITQGTTVLYSGFEERIIFPIKDHLGNFCGFGGRIFKAHDERAKYYNSRENDYFSKGSLLFGFDCAKSSIQKTEIVFLVEGYIDCTTMAKHGYHNTVATLGTACTLDQLKILSRYANKLLIVYDADKAGNDAVLRMAELCWQVNMELHVISLPTGEDPASFLNKGGTLRERIAVAPDIFTFFIANLGKDFATKSLNHKITLVRKIIDIINKIDDPLKQDLLLHKGAKSLDMPYDTLKQELDRSGHKKGNQASVAPAENSGQTAKHATKLEKKLFFAILHNTQLLNTHIERYVRACLPASLQTLADTFLQEKEKDPTYDFTQFFSTLGASERSQISLLMLEVEFEVTDHELKQLMIHVQKKYWKSIVHDITTQLAEAQKRHDQQTVDKLLHDFLQLKKDLLENHATKNGDPTI